MNAAAAELHRATLTPSADSHAALHADLYSDPHVDSRISPRAVTVEFTDGRTQAFEDCWLRDHCRCSSCYHEDTFQRAFHILDIPDAKIVDMTYDSTELIITWDDKHRSVYKAEFLSQYVYTTWSSRKGPQPVLWSGPAVSGRVARVHVDEFLNSKDGAKRVFQSLLDYGFVFIEGVEVSLKGTEVVCAALGGVQHTLFGGMWQFSSQSDGHADTAYTSLPLATHNDSTYFTEATGLQILHCLEHSGGCGGETTLVDGFHGAAALREQHPDYFHFLATFQLEAEYIEDGHHHKHTAPVISLNGDGSFKQIRFNVYDRAPQAFASSRECRAYYGALRGLARHYQDPINQYRFKLQPGTLVAFDNWRVLHGRTGFGGRRVLAGSYVARSDWLDRARVLRLVH